MKFEEIKHCYPLKNVLLSPNPTQFIVETREKVQVLLKFRHCICVLRMIGRCRDIRVRRVCRSAKSALSLSEHFDT